MATSLLSDDDISALVNARHSDPFAILGPHRSNAQLLVRVFLPGADRVLLNLGAELRPGAALPFERIHADGLFEVLADVSAADSVYTLSVYRGEHQRLYEDPFRFSPVYGEETLGRYAAGEAFDCDRFLGAHCITHEGVAGVVFSVWAPNAQRVSVVGDFNDWDGRVHPMRRRYSSGIWEIFLPQVGEGARYKYEVVGIHGQRLPLKADPFARYAERPPATASVVAPTTQYVWGDDEWMGKRAERQSRAAPISVYEVHLGSWRRVADENNRYLDYDELTAQLIPHVADLGFTHIELLPLTEYPFDGSWGYQPLSQFAPSSRFGDPDGFRRFVDGCHRAGLGVILDWVPGHFPNDPHGIARFDGTALYEHEDERQGYHPDWNTYIYNFGRHEVQNYLIASARYWLREFHLDGIRVDAVASMLYLDYSRKDGQWIPNEYGGKENLQAIAFNRRLNEILYADFPDIATFAEESTSWPNVSRPVWGGGLGYGFKWNMGWMNDTLSYMGRDPVHRCWHHNEMTFGMVYAFSENFILPLSHDEVVHGKGSLLDRMPGDAWQKFANLRACYGFMWAHPGKKLLFMGGEFAQGREWNHDGSLDWHLLETHWHQGVQRLIADLNRLYCTRAALHSLDCESEGHQWLRVDDAERSLFAFARWSKGRGALCLAVANFTPVVRYAEYIGVPLAGRYTEAINNRFRAVWRRQCRQSGRGAVRARCRRWLRAGHPTDATAPGRVAL